MKSWHLKYALIMSGLFAITVGYNACSEDAGFSLVEGVDSLEEFNSELSNETVADPEPTIVINNNDEYTREAVVNLTLDPDGPADMMFVSNTNDCSEGSWEAFQQNKLWTLQQQNQQASVFVKYRFHDSPESECVQDDIVHDDVAPEIAFTQGVGTLWIKDNNVSILYTVTDSGSGVQEIQCDRSGSGTFQACGNNVYYSNLTENTNYLLVVRAIDKAGNMADPEQLNWRPDFTPPTVVFNTTPAAVTADVTPDFTYTGNDLGSGIALLECKLDDAPYAPCTGSTSLSGLADGAHSFTVRATDGVGHVSTPATYNWMQDSLAPTIEFTQTPMAIEKSDDATFAFRVVAGDIAAYQCQLDGGAYQACTSPHNLTGLSDASHTFSVVGVDGVGNTSSPISYSWLVDTMPPTIAFVETPDAIESADMATFSFSAQDLGSGLDRIECRVDANAYATCQNTMVFNALGNGPHSVDARSLDRAGNVSATISYNWMVDNQVPTITIDTHPTNPTSESLANFTFTATDAGSGVDFIECKLDGTPIATCTSPANYNGLRDGNHIFIVRATDNAGNRSQPAVYTWVVDKTPPDLSFISQPNAVEYVGSTPKVSFTGNDGNGSGVASYTCLYNNTPLACAAQAAYEYPADAEGNHTFMVTAVDAVGNQTSISTTWEVQYLVTEYTTDFEVRPERPVDILFVVDNSGSMDEERENLGQRIHGFLSEIDNLDWQIAVTSTDVTGGNDYQNGRIVDFTGDGLFVLDSSMDVNLAQQLFENKVTIKNKDTNPLGIPGWGDGNEQGIYATARVVDRAVSPQDPEDAHNSAFIRDGADFVAVVLSDENENSEGKADKVKYQPQEFLDRFNSQFTDPKNFTFHSIVVMSGDEDCLTAGIHPHYYGTLYEDLSKLTGFGQPGGGTIGSVCEQNYTTQLSEIGKSVTDLAKTVSLQCAPVDTDNDGKPDVTVEYQDPGSGVYAPYTAPYTVQGQQIAYQDYLPVGHFRFHYDCSGTPSN